MKITIALTHPQTAPQRNWMALAKHRARTKKENVQRVVQKMVYNERRKHLSKWLMSVKLSWFFFFAFTERLQSQCMHRHSLPSCEQPSPPLAYAFIQTSYADTVRGDKNITPSDGGPPLSLMEINFLVRLQEVGITSQNLTFKQHQTPTSVLLAGTSYTAFLYKE